MLPYFQFAMLYNFLFASHSMPQSVRRFQDSDKLWSRFLKIKFSKKMSQEHY